MITTNDNRIYNTNPIKTPSASTLENVYAEAIVNDDNTEGIAIFSDSSSATDTSVFLRYKYEETYEIIPPFISQIEPINPYEEGMMCGEPKIMGKIEEDTKCYKTNYSTDIILVSTNDLSENRVEKFMVRFINKNDFIIRDRYSILVNQFTQSAEAFNFYKTLKEFSNLENLFSQLQAGFISGNIIPVTNPQEKVLGIFEISPVTSKRIFFDFEDFFPNERKPPFIVECGLKFVNTDALISNINNNIRSLVYIGTDCSKEGDEKHFFTKRICSDCRVSGSNIVPEFWEN